MRSSGSLRRFPLFMLAACAALFAPPGQAVASTVRARVQSPTTLRLEVRTDGPTISTTAEGVQEVSVADLPNLTEPGRPALPYRTVLVAIPSGSELRLESVTGPAGRLGQGRLLPVRAPEGRSPFDVETGEEAASSEAIQPVESGSGAEWYPETLAVIQKHGIFRDQAYAEIRVFPVQYRESDGELRFHARLDLNVRFEATGHGPIARRVDPIAATGREVTGVFDTLLRETFVNFDMIAADRAQRRAAPDGDTEHLVAPATGAFDAATAGSSGLIGTAGSVKLSVLDPGLYAVTRAQLAAVGVDVTMLDPRTFHMTAGGVDVPIYVEGEADGTFDTADRLVFYGHGIQGDRFNRINIYWLTFGGTAGPRVATRSGSFTGAGTTPASFMTTVHAEQNLNYTARIRPGVTEAWYWAIQVRGFSSTTVPYAVTLPRVDPAAHTIAARAQMLGLTAGNHTPRLLINGTQVAENTFADQVMYVQSASGASSLLLSGANTFTLTLVNNGNMLDQVASDFFEVDYRRTYQVDGDQLLFDGEGSGNLHLALSNLGSNDLFLFDVTAAGTPSRITIPAGQIIGAGPFTASFEDILVSDRAYAISSRAALKTPISTVLEIPSTLASPTNGADWILITDRSMLGAAAPLVALRQSQGLRTALVATDDIYDEFSFGKKTPLAITSFLSYAYFNWVAPAPTYVVLMGDGHIDFTDNLGTGTPQIIPPYLLPFPNFGEAPSDNAFVTVAGNDDIPEMFLGRMPVRTPGEASAMVANIVAYENAPPVGVLNQQSLYVADNNDVIFQAILDNLMDFTPATMGGATAYLPGGDPNNPPTQTEINATTTAIVNGLNAGSLVSTYLGHGNVTLWAKEKVFEHTTNPPVGGTVRADLDLLTASGNQTFLLSLNCINGYFADFVGAGPGHADYSLAEEFLRRPGRGAVAAYAPSAIGQLSDYDSISYEVFNHLFVEGIATLGPAAIGASIDAIAVFGVSTDNVESMIFFGDPATRLALDSDADGLMDRLETAAGSNPLDGDSDDDGLADGVEVLNLLTSPVNHDTDGDGIFDGTERGVSAPLPGTDLVPEHFVADADPLTTTNPAVADTDGGGADDGDEDLNHNGAINAGETDPNNPADDVACPGPLVQVANVLTTRSGSNVVLTWDAVPAIPCATFRVYAATNAGFPKSSFAAFVPIGDVSTTTFTHVGAAGNGNNYDYLIVVVHPQLGVGPFGAYGQ